MAKMRFPVERRKKEGKFLEEKFSLTKSMVPNITRAGLAKEMGVGAAVWSQWVSGSTRIPDKHLFYMARRLGFDPVALRPELAVYDVAPYIQADGQLLEKLGKMTALQRAFIYEMVDLVSEYLI